MEVRVQADFIFITWLLVEQGFVPPFNLRQFTFNRMMLLYTTYLVLLCTGKISVKKA